MRKVSIIIYREWDSGFKRLDNFLVYRLVEMRSWEFNLRSLIVKFVCFLLREAVVIVMDTSRV